MVIIVRNEIGSDSTLLSVHRVQVLRHKYQSIKCIEIHKVSGNVMEKIPLEADIFVCAFPFRDLTFLLNDKNCFVSKKLKSCSW